MDGIIEWLTAEPYRAVVLLATLITLYYTIRTYHRKRDKSAPDSMSISTGDKVNVETGGGSQPIVATKGATVNIGISLKDHTEALREQEKRLRREYAQTTKRENPEKHEQLEIELKAGGEKLANLEESYKEEVERLQSALEELDGIKEQLSEAQIREASDQLRSGNTEAAEKLFDANAETGSESAPLAAYQSGQLAEGRLDYAKAMRQYRKAVTLDENNPDYLLAAGIMARTLGHYDEARSWLEKLLQLRDNEAKDTIDLARAQHELGWLYDDIGQYEKAKPWYQRSLAITEKSLGRDHPDVAAILNNLGELHRKQGQYGRAEPLYHRSLAIKEKSLGRDHPSVATTLNNLAALYGTLSQYEKAEPLYERALAITEKSLGKDHPLLATTLNNLGELYKKQGQYGRAEPLYQRDLAITEKSLGRDHPSVAITLNNLAGLYEDMGQYEKAESLYQRSLEIHEKTLVRDHPEMATTLNNLALLYGDMGQYEKAEPFYQRSLAILRRAFPDGHPNIDVGEENYARMKKEWKGR